MWHDLRQAFRVIFTNPSFTAVAVLTLGLGIGANTAIFSVVNSVLLSPLQYPNPERIVALHTRFPSEGHVTARLTGGDLTDIRKEVQAFDALSTYMGGEMGVQLKDHAEFTGVYLVNPAFFQVFGMQPLYGRFFNESEAGRAAVVSTTFAERNFGGASLAIGKSIHVESWNLEIVGVVPSGFRFPKPTEVWVAQSSQPQNLDRTAYNYTTVARLKPDVSLSSASSQLQTIGSRLASAFPASNKDKTFGVTPLQDQLTGPVRSLLLFLLGSVSLVLLIACANVANLLLARASSRSREFAVRIALGASRWQVIRQLLTENAILAFLGGTLGIILVTFGLDILIRLAPALPRFTEVHIDRSVLLFTMVVSLAASLLFGLAPALQASRTDINHALKQGGSRGLLGSQGNAIRKTLVVAEISLAVVLAIEAGLLFRSFLALHSTELGYRTEGVLVMYTHAPAKGLEGYVATAKSLDVLFSQLQTIPGVRSAAGAMGLPTGLYGSFGGYIVEGNITPDQKLPQAGFRLASPAYFETLGIPLRQGRDFTARDAYDAPFVAIISEALARQSFPNQDPIGRRIQCGLDSEKWMTIIGIAGDVRQNSPASSPAPELYMPLQQHPFHANELQVVLRTSTSPLSLITSVRDRARKWNPEAAVRFTTLDAMVSDSLATPRFRTFLAGLFAAFALILAMAGIYGVISFLVTQRTSEFGLRIALGANPSEVLRLILRQAAALTAVGLLLGVAASFALHRILAGMLFGIAPAGAATYATVTASICAITLLAAFIPSRRATRIDPITALREE